MNLTFMWNPCPVTLAVQSEDWHIFYNGQIKRVRIACFSKKKIVD